MTALAGLLAQCLHLALMLAVAPLHAGLLHWFEARLQGGGGPSPLQPWRDLIRLARKQPLLVENASALFHAAPAAGFVTLAAAAALVPSFALGMTSAPLADLLLLAGLLSLARATAALAALDAGNPLSGLGASRATQIAALAEPALLVVFFALALAIGTTNLDALASGLADGHPPPPALALAAIALLIVAVAATNRRPAASPGTLQELAMDEAALALDYGGRDRALILWTGELRLLLWLSLLAILILPSTAALPGADLLDWLAGLLAWAAKIAVLTVALAVLEATRSRLRLRRLPALLGAALALGLLAVLLLFVSAGIV